MPWAFQLKDPAQCAGISMNDTTHQTTHETDGTDIAPRSNAGFIHSFAMPEPGHRIGPNRILELIAEGGMANVYKVWHEGLEIVRAIKILKPGFNEESKQRLQTEAKISAHLHHPNIVEIYGVNFWKDLVPYIEMEYIDGLSLKDTLKYQKHMHFSFAIAIGYFVCNALHYAHNQFFTLYGKPYQGVIHRDIKPANILISRSGTVKLADFGIAKPSEISLHTVGHKVMGTFSYLSPEQLNGEGLDRRCDIYSLGIVLYEIITGVKAFPQKNLNEIIQKKMLNEFKPLDSFDIDCPRQLHSILEKSTELKKEKRYTTANDFAEELTDLLKKISDKSPDSIISSYVQNPEAAPRIGRKKRNVVPLISFISSVVLVSVATLFMLFWPNRHQESGAAGLQSEKMAPSPPLPQPTGAPAAEPTIPKVRAKKDVSLSTGTEEKIEHPSTPIGMDQIKAGLSAVALKHFKEAIPRLESAMKKQLPDSLHAAVAFGLLEAYVAVKRFVDAQHIASTEFINDGYYHLLCGKTFFALGKFDRAIESFGNAQTIPSKRPGATLREATCLWSKTLYEIYKSKPNAENKRAALRAWQQFSKAFCGDVANAGQCDEAVERVLELGK
jgi:serine/threonine protein kinase